MAPFFCIELDLYLHIILDIEKKFFCGFYTLLINNNTGLICFTYWCKTEKKQKTKKLNGSKSVFTPALFGSKSQVWTAGPRPHPAGGLSLLPNQPWCSPPRVKATLVPTSSKIAVWVSSCVFLAVRSPWVVVVALIFSLLAKRPCCKTSHHKINIASEASEGQKLALNCVKHNTMSTSAKRWSIVTVYFPYFTALACLSQSHRHRVGWFVFSPVQKGSNRDSFGILWTKQGG